MLIEQIEYRDEQSLLNQLEGSVLKSCVFKGFSVDGKNADAIFIFCELDGLDWYWGLFNNCLFVDTQFKNCVFRGSTFADCRFLNCEFTDCQFIEDNLNKPCTFEGSQWFGGKALRCIGLPAYAFPKDA